MPQMRYDQSPPAACLALLLGQHPRPWRIGYTRQGDGQVEDGRGQVVTTFDATEALECDYHRGIVAAVNLWTGAAGGNHAA